MDYDYANGCCWLPIASLNLRTGEILPEQRRNIVPRNPDKQERAALSLTQHQSTSTGTRTNNNEQPLSLTQQHSTSTGTKTNNNDRAAFVIDSTSEYINVDAVDIKLYDLCSSPLMSMFVTNMYVINSFSIETLCYHNVYL